MPFTLEFTQSALDDLAVFEKRDQVRILDRVGIQLTNQPIAETRSRKPLEPNALAEWELRIGGFRVFYDVNEAEAIVKVKAVGCKEHNKLYIRRKEYKL
ncbi:MAG TPA: type II toxin-antitoxin system RelE/ParE family toxin [Pirellulales bacterium]|nr:type II toxin-antitoxin system RelE/ParE family toxin [Pirellulales bacterium]